MRILVPFCLAICSLYGQAGTLGAPSTGFVFDQSAHALRQIQGIPGAALVGTPVDFGLAVTAAWAAPRLDSAFVLAADGQAHLFRLSANAPPSVPSIRWVRRRQSSSVRREPPPRSIRRAACK